MGIESPSLVPRPPPFLPSVYVHNNTQERKTIAVNANGLGTRLRIAMELCSVCFEQSCSICGFLTIAYTRTISLIVTHVYNNIYVISSPLLCGCYVIECIIFQIKPCSLYPVGIKYR